MPTLKPTYTSASQITCTVNGLSNSAQRQSNYVDNTTNLYLDVLVGGEFTTASGTLASPAYVNIYVYALTDGTNYSGAASGSDSSCSLAPYKNYPLLATIYINQAGTTEYFSPRSVASLFGGVLPQKWGVFVDNETGLAMASSGGGNLYYVGYQITSS